MTYLNLSEVMEIIGKSYKTVNTLVKNNAFPGAIKRGRSWQIPLLSVENYKLSLNKIPDGYLTLEEIAERLELTRLWVSRLAVRGIFNGAKKHRGTWIVPSDSLVQYVNRLASPEGFLSIPEAADYLSVSYSWIVKLILKNVLSEIEVINGVRYIRKECAENYLKSILPPEGYMTISQAAEYLSVSKEVATALAQNGGFLGAKKQKIAYHQAGWIIPIEALIQFNELKRNHVYASDIAKELGVSVKWISKQIREGVIPKGKKNRTDWIVPIEESIKFINSKRKIIQEMKELSSPIKLFEYKVSKMELPDKLRETVNLYREFVILKINSSQASKKTIHNRALEYAKTLERLLKLLETEVFLLDVDQLEDILQNPAMKIYDLSTLIYFLEYCTGKGLCSFSKKYAVTALSGEQTEVYSPEQFLGYYNYVKNIDLHVHQAIQSRDYAVTWLYVLMHVIDAWRPSDIVKLPNVTLELCSITTFDQIKVKMSMGQAQKIINHLYKRMERMYISKTGALGHFLVNQDMVIPTATVLVISEIHRRNAKDQQLMRIGQRRFIQFEKHPHFSSFFSERMDLLDFKSRKMNRTLLTYFFYSVVEKNESANIAYELAQKLRGHVDLDVTATYIQSMNKDGSIQQVSLNLFNRGHFGWLYQHLITLSMPEGTVLDLEQGTTLIEQIRSEFSPFQMEQMGHFLAQQQNHKNSLALRLSNLTEKELSTLLLKIYKGEMPAKLQHVQCVTYPKCQNPTATTCLHCENSIPKVYILISINHELERLISSIQSSNYPAIRIRDSKFLFQILDLLSQAVQQFGKTYVQSFIDLDKVKQKIRVIQNQISEESYE
ncbi:helix-turn-helix domain-containing protein [Paenibacillus sp. FSL R7-0652]|uniref:helix-turn-helix domain-containing protein n=1 Tax=Paenibacillus sp. FSL R7-0652 TaxID=2921687 RepID=UPI00315A9927